MEITHSTDMVSQTERFNFWESIISDNYVRIHCELKNQDNNLFKAKLSQRKFGDILLNDHQMNVSMRYHREESDICQDQRQDLQFILLLSGFGQISQEGRSADINTGDMVLYDSSKPFLLDYSNNHRALNIKFPKELIHNNLGDIEPFVARTVKGNSVMGSLTQSMMKEYAALPNLATLSSEVRLSSALLEVLSTALDVEFAGQIDLNQRKINRLNSVKQSLLLHIGNSELNATAIAQMNNMTTRTLNRLFAIEGTTAIKWLWEKRLEESYKMLREGKVSRVSDVAIYYGFNDFSHFSRAFKKAFNQTPRQILNHKK
ncbi:helix-turn-helix domain-containing protein [Celerinatantimonas sp. MCCC 1A17872]|uniref:helix-turn-helix domain-containing protein n=1 Tax=Celerinatantimonas sp. MCCC 1A17872 TaxID=3177514 RepID=UPI0038C8B197